MSDSSHGLPKLDHIPLLEGSQNSHDWFRAMTQILKAEGVWGHVEGVDNDLSAVWQASYPPTLTATSSNTQRQASTAWWIKDSRAVAIIDCRINTIPRSHLPVGDTVTARTIWAKLKALYNRIDTHAQFELKDRIANNFLRDPADYMRFIGEFDSCRSRLAAMDSPISEVDAIHTILRQIPNTGSWPQFKLSVNHFVQTWMEFDAIRDPLAPAAPNSIYSKVIARLEQECLLLLSTTTSTKNGPGSEYVNFAGTTSIKKTSKNPLGVVCTNCKLDNHDFDHCWKQGGGSVGQWPGGPNDPNAKTSKLISSSSIATSKPKADLIAAVLPFVPDKEMAEISSSPNFYDLSC